jgi:RES domain-containing protein
VIGYKELLTVLPKLQAASYAGTLFRRVNLAALQSVEPHQFLYALGAGKEGARFTPKRGPASLYAAEDELTAEAESKQGGFENFRKAAAPPSVVYSLKVSLNAVLDLTDARVVKKTGSSRAELAAQWRLHRKKAPTQILGLAAFNSGNFDALRYRSTKNPKGICYVIFTQRLEGDSFVELHDPEEKFSERIPTVNNIKLRK